MKEVESRREKLQHTSSVKTRRVLYVVSKIPETVRVGRSVLKAGMHNFKRDDGFSEKCRNGCELEVSKSKLPLSLFLL